MRTFLTVALMGALAGCGTTPATPAQLEATEQRLVAPFLTGTEVGCNELLVEMTGNFNPYVSQPALDPNAHKMRLEEGDGFIDKVWTNTLGRPQTSFVVAIGEPSQVTDRGMMRGATTRFTVMNQFRLRIYHKRHEVTLKARQRLPRL